MGSILVVDDEPQIRRFLRAGLSVHGYALSEVASGEEALRVIPRDQPDLVVLDLGLPDMDGMEVLRRLREWSQVPVIVLSVRSQEREKVRALEAGADDYVSKPFGMAEFVARIRSALRRRLRETAPEPVYTVGKLKIDLARRMVTRDGQQVRLSPKEYQLLRLLALHAGKVVTHRQLLTEIWGPAYGEHVQYLRVFVRKLRSRLEADPNRPDYLVTELGVGYRLVAPDQFHESA
ncbi:MAG: response regulator [Alphaproteobacteria bacterium]|nr:response regulator [Alphaproteobacteria bacterium]